MTPERPSPPACPPAEPAGREIARCPPPRLGRTHFHVVGQAEPPGRWFRRSQIAFHPQSQQPQLPPRTYPPPEPPRRPPPRQQQQTARQQQPHQHTPQPRRGGCRSPIQREILLAIAKVLLRLHPFAILRHRHLGVGQRCRQIPGFPMPPAPVQYQVHRHCPIGTIADPRQKHIAIWTQGILPQQSLIAIGSLDVDIAFESHHIVHCAASVTGHFL